MEILYNSREAYKLMHDGILALSRAEQQGMRIDMDYCITKSKHITRKIEYLENKTQSSNFYKHWRHTLGGKEPNLNSGTQLAHYLYNVKGYEPKKLTKSGTGSTDEDALNQLNIPELSAMLQARKLKKLRDTYLGAFMREQVNGYFHPFFNLHTVVTYRSSSSNPNFQNIPKRDKESMKICRKAIYPRPGHQLLEVDFGALEVRIAACYHQDPTMLKYIKDPTTDMHGDMAKQIFSVPDFDRRLPEHALLRAGAKNGFVFPQFYGDYYGNCAVALLENWGKLPSKKWSKTDGVSMPNGTTLGAHLIEQGLTNANKFTKHLQKIEDHFWNVRFPVYKKWKEKLYSTYQKNGYVDMYTGFRCKGIMFKNDAINYPIQGAAFHCLLWCFIRLDAIIQNKGWKTRLIGQIHDAILLDVHPSELEEVAKTVRLVTTGDLPRNFKWINVPLEVEADLAGVDESWADLRPYELP